MLLSYKGTTLIMISTMTMIMFNNTMELMPYVFTISAHLVYSMSLALPVWASYKMYGWMKNTQNIYTSCTHVMLTPFVIMIEKISNIMRPGSLSVRLTANMIAEHVLMSLLGNNNSSNLIILYSVVCIMLMTNELSVAMNQSYVFMTLMYLYSS